MSTRYYLNYAGKSLELKGKKNYLIGRKDESDILLDNDFVSRDHAVISWEDEGYVILDLQSTNGTLVNGEKIAQHPLTNGDKIAIGSTTIEFQIQTPSPSTNDTDTLVI